MLPPRPPLAPATDAVRMIAPPSGMTGIACLIRKNAPLTLTLNLCLRERRPAAVFFVPAGALLARVVQEPPRDIFPDGVAAEEADSIHGLNFHGPLAAPADDAQHVVLELR